MTGLALGGAGFAGQPNRFQHHRARASKKSDNSSKNPTTSSTNGAGLSAEAAVAAGVAAGESAKNNPQPFWHGWEAALKEQTTKLQAHANNLGQEWEATAKKLSKQKWDLPVHVDVDMIGPQVETIKAGMLSGWQQLPPSARVFLPYLACSLGSGLIVYKTQQARWRSEHAKAVRLKEKVTALIKENDELTDRLTSYKSRDGVSPAHSSETQLRMAAAVAKATQAAAQASSAAAHAAEVAAACVIHRGRAPTAGQSTRADHHHQQQQLAQPAAAIDVTTDG